MLRPRRYVPALYSDLDPRQPMFISHDVLLHIPWIVHKTSPWLDSALQYLRLEYMF